MQNLEIDELLDNVMMNAANVCGNLTTIKTSFDELKKELEAKDEEIRKCYEHNIIQSKDICKLSKEIESRKKAFNDLKEEMANRYITIETHYDICKTYENRIGELEEDSKTLHERLYSAEELITKLSKENEKLKVEVTEALAKRDYYQDLANKEAADAKKVKQDCEKEMEWQKKKLQEFDYVLTKYRAKIKELENANGFSELVINLIIKE